MLSSEPSTPLDPVEALERLGRLPLRENGMMSLLQAVADLAREVMPGRPETSVSLLINDRPSTAVSTGELARACDESQYGRGYGPCLHAAGTGEVVEVADARSDPRWPDYLAHAVELGVLSSLSVPLPIAEGIVGAVNVYAREPDAFDEHSRAVATRFAAHAAAVAANMYAYEEVRDLADHLERRAESRAVIEQAKGVLMAQRHVDADAAFEILREASQRYNRKLRDIAQAIVDGTRG